MKAGQKTLRNQRKSDAIVQRLIEAEQLFRQFKELTPFRFHPFAKSFDSFDEYQRWKRAQKNPWYR
ncbi:MAG TPA: hypothetical protein VI895_00390 [Bdellovibrionota bacterium]|nr:hypothetical protein [Bdellovibrionota bacterium]